ncbi:hypothetical protein ACFLUG_03060 [Chloroflexota bacterium]
MVIQIVGYMTALVVVLGFVLAVLVWKKKIDYGIFFKAGITVIVASILLMAVSFFLQIIFFVGIPILALGIIYIVVGSVGRNKHLKTD